MGEHRGGSKQDRPKPQPVRTSEMDDEYSGFEDDDYWHEGEEEEGDYYDNEVDPEDDHHKNRQQGSKGARVVSQYNETITFPMLSPQATEDMSGRGTGNTSGLEDSEEEEASDME